MFALNAVPNDLTASYIFVHNSVSFCEDCGLLGFSTLSVMKLDLSKISRETICLQTRLVFFSFNRKTIRQFSSVKPKSLLLVHPTKTLSYKDVYLFAKPTPGSALRFSSFRTYFLLKENLCSLFQLQFSRKYPASVFRFIRLRNDNALSKFQMSTVNRRGVAPLFTGAFKRMLRVQHLKLD